MAISFRIRIYVFTGIFVMYFLLELVMSHITHSLTLLIDAYHTLYNLMALTSYIVALKMSNEQSLKNTFGWARIEVLSMLVSILALGALCFSTTVEAIQTVLHATHSDAMHHPLEVLVIGVVGVFQNVICFLFIGGFSFSRSFVNVSRHEVQVSVTVAERMPTDPKPTSNLEFATVEEKESLRCQAYVDLCRDLSCSFLVIICSATVHLTTGDLALYIDPALSVVAVVILMSTTVSFVKESGMILLQTVPTDMNVSTVKTNLMKQFPSIKNVHHLHIWRLTRHKVIATAHVIFESPASYAKINEELNEFFHKQGISQATIQPEFNEGLLSSVPLNTECQLKCRTTECQMRMCCKDCEVEQISQDIAHCHSHSHAHSEPTHLPCQSQETCV